MIRRWLLPLLVGIPASFAIMLATVRLVADPSAVLLPWAEANQGLLTLLALLAALAVALYENARANNANDARRREFVDLVVGLTKRAMDACDEGIARIAHGHAAAEEVTTWNRERENIENAVGAILPTVPPDAKLALETAKFRQALAHNPAWIGLEQGATAQQFSNLKTLFETSRAAILLRR